MDQIIEFQIIWNKTDWIIIEQLKNNLGEYRTEQSFQPPWPNIHRKLNPTTSKHMFFMIKITFTKIQNFLVQKIRLSTFQNY